MALKTEIFWRMVLPAGIVALQFRECGRRDATWAGPSGRSSEYSETPGHCQDAIRWPVCNQYVDIVGEVFTGTDDNIRILRHLQAAMVAMGVGECDDDFIIKRYHKPGSL